MIDTVFFDLDNTIFDFNKAEHIALAKTLEELVIPPSEETCARYSVINLDQWKLLEKGVITRREVKLRRFRLLFEELGVPAAPEEAAARYESLLGIGHYFMDGAEELLQTLYGNYRLYLVTNGTAAVQKGRLESAQLQKYFEDIFISEEIGFNKPDIRYFESCFSRIPSFSRETSVIVGDSLTSDIQGGINAGIRTVWFHPEREASGTAGEEEAVRPDREIRKLMELPELLRNWDSAGRQ